MIEIPTDQFSGKYLCGVDNVVYMHYQNVGLLWYNFKEKEWRLVHGLKLNSYLWSVAMESWSSCLLSDVFVTCTFKHYIGPD